MRTERKRALSGLVKRAKQRAAARLDALVALIERRKQRIAEDYYDIGLALLEIKKKRLYTADGCKTLEALLEKRRLFGRTTAAKLMAIASAYTREQVVGLDFEKAYAIVRYVEATPKIDSVGEIVEKGVVLGGRRVPVQKLSAREITRDTRVVRRNAHRASSDEKAAVAVARKLQAALRSRGARGATASAIHGKGGWMIALRLSLDGAKLLLEP